MLRITPIAAVFVLASVLTPAVAYAEFLAPDWATLSINGVQQPDWVAGVREDAYIGMCLTCDGSMMLEIKTVPDDGTGRRVRSGETTAQTFTEIGETNAGRIGGDAAYFGTKAIEFGSAMGFKTRARIATGDYSATYQLWSDGQQLIVRVYGADQAKVDAMAANAFEAAAPLTFR
jgi:hypothetical protein